MLVAPACLYVCTCVCVREERERGRWRESQKVGECVTVQLLIPPDVLRGANTFQALVNLRNWLHKNHQITVVGLRIAISAKCLWKIVLVWVLYLGGIWTPCLFTVTHPLQQVMMKDKMALEEEGNYWSFNNNKMEFGLICAIVGG